MNCSATENTDLFYSVPWSHGTLGFVVSVELQIVRARPYVELAYLPFHSQADACREFARHSREAKYDFVECLAYSRDKHVLMLGTLVDTKRIPGAVYNPIGRWYKEWFYKHVEHCLEGENTSNGSLNHDVTAEGTSLMGVHHREVIPLRDYYHRHTRGLFWEMSDIVPFGNNVVFRLLLGWMMPPRPSLLKRTQTEALRKLYEQHHMVQDMLVPISHLQECLDVFEREAGIYPLWLCPFRIPRNGSNTTDGPSRYGAVPVAGAGAATKERGFIHPCDGGRGEDLFVDVGAYGNPSVPHYEARESHRRIEDYVRSVQGYQMMYADSYMTR